MMKHSRSRSPRATPNTGVMAAALDIANAAGAAAAEIRNSGFSPPWASGYTSGLHSSPNRPFNVVELPTRDAYLVANEASWRSGQLPRAASGRARQQRPDT